MIRAAHIPCLLLLLVGCSQSYQLVPLGDDAALKQHTRVVLLADVVGGGVPLRKLALEQMYSDTAVLSAFRDCSADFQVRQVIKGTRSDPQLHLAHLSLQHPYVPIVPRGLLPIAVPQLYAPFTYEVGYNSQFLGRFYGLWLMPTSTPDPLLSQIERHRWHVHLPSW